MAVEPCPPLVKKTIPLPGARHPCFVSSCDHADNLPVGVMLSPVRRVGAARGDVEDIARVHLV